SRGDELVDAIAAVALAADERDRVDHLVAERGLGALAILLRPGLAHRASLVGEAAPFGECVVDRGGEISRHGAAQKCARPFGVVGDPSLKSADDFEVARLLAGL